MKVIRTAVELVAMLLAAYVTAEAFGFWWGMLAMPVVGAFSVWAHMYGFNRGLRARHEYWSDKE